MNHTVLLILILSIPVALWAGLLLLGSKFCPPGRAPGCTAARQQSSADLRLNAKRQPLRSVDQLHRRLILRSAYCTRTFTADPVPTATTAGNHSRILT